MYTSKDCPCTGSWPAQRCHQAVPAAWQRKPQNLSTVFCETPCSMALRCTPCFEPDCPGLQVKTVAEVNNVDVSEAVKDLEVRAEQVSCCLLCFVADPGSAHMHPSCYGRWCCKHGVWLPALWACMMLVRRDQCLWQCNQWQTRSCKISLRAACMLLCLRVAAA